MTRSEMQRFVKELAPGVHKAIEQAIAPLTRELAELRSRQSIAEAKAHINFRGVYMPGTAYDRGDAVVRQGGLWIALERTASLPGGTAPESRSWQLAVKSGGT
jgi:hypothetical protein